LRLRRLAKVKGLKPNILEQLLEDAMEKTCQCRIYLAAMYEGIATNYIWQCYQVRVGNGDGKCTATRVTQLTTRIDQSPCTSTRLCNHCAIRPRSIGYLYSRWPECRRAIGSMAHTKEHDPATTRDPSIRNCVLRLPIGGSVSMWSLQTRSIRQVLGACVLTELHDIITH
jgi:hypothetical protein